MTQLTQVSKEAKTIIAAILATLKENGDTSIKIDNNAENSGIMPLHVELIGTGIESYCGIGNLYSFAHYYEQNGDLMKDPEIVYYVVDNRGEDVGNMDMLGVFPQMWQQDGVIGGYRELITIENNKLKSFIPKLQKETAQFTGQWMRNIKWQQNIVPVKETRSQAARPSTIKDKYVKLLEAAKQLGFTSINDAIQAGKEQELFRIVGS